MFQYCDRCKLKFIKDPSVVHNCDSLYTCLKCGHDCLSKGFLIIHNSRGLCLKSKHTCEYCGNKYEYKNERGLSKHVRENHKVITCEKCQCKYRMGTSHKCNSNISCPDCNEVFDTQDNLNIHTIVQACKPVKICAKCQGEWRLSKLFLKHLSKCGQEKEKNGSMGKLDGTDASDKIKPPLSCPDCNKIFKSKQILENHLNLKICKTKICPGCKEAFGYRQFSNHYKNCKDSFTTCGECRLIYHKGVNHLCNAEFHCSSCHTSFTNKTDHDDHHTLQTCRFAKTCPGCKMRYADENEFKDHFLSCSKVKEAICNQCNHKYRLRSAHKCNFDLVCPHCKVLLADKTSLENHIVQQSCYKIKNCSRCNHIYQSSSDFNSHLQECIPKYHAQQRIMCRKCGVYYSEDVNHECYAQYSCSECGECFQEELLLSRHRVLQTCRALPKCPGCHLQFYSSKSLEVHIMVCKDFNDTKTAQFLNEDLRPKCPNCRKIFYSHRPLPSHLKICLVTAKNINDQKESSSGEIKSINLIKTCIGCKQKYGHYDSYKHHFDACIHVPYPKSVLHCFECHRNYNKEVNHECNADYYCSECGEAFRNIVEVNKHITDLSCRHPSKCSGCNVQLDTKRDASKHYENCHKLLPAQKVVCCYDCKKQYFYGLRHECDLENSCSHCGKSYNTKYKLEEHILKQTCKNLKECVPCHSEFSTEQDLVQHQQMCIHYKVFDFKKIVQYKENFVHFGSQKTHCVCNNCGIYLTSNQPGIHSQYEQNRNCYGCHARVSVGAILSHWRKCDKIKILKCTDCGRQYREGVKHYCNSSFACDNCGEMFKKNTDLIRHELHRECFNGNKCMYCNRSYMTLSGLSIHFQSCNLLRVAGRFVSCSSCGFKCVRGADHICNSEFMCDECGTSFPDAIHLNYHLIKQSCMEEKTCPGCHRGYVKGGNYLKHVFACTKIKSLKCEDCNKTYRQSNMHVCYSKLFCDGCGDCFPNCFSFKTHQSFQICRGVKTCIHCNKRVQGWSALKAHRRVCDKQKVKTCPICCKQIKLISHYYYLKHFEICKMRKRYGTFVVCRFCHKKYRKGSSHNCIPFLGCSTSKEEFTAETEEIEECEDNQDFTTHHFPCPLCVRFPKAFANKTMFLQHWESHEPVKNQLGSCCYCFKTVSLQDFEDHLNGCYYYRPESKDLICQFCNGEFISVKCHYLHYNTICCVSNLRKGYVCGDCPFISDQQSVVVEHVKQFHFKESVGGSKISIKGFSCYSCGECFDGDEHFARFHARTCYDKFII